MASVTYSEILRDSQDPFNFRLRIVEYAKQESIRAAAKYFGCSRNTVRKWLRRWQNDGPKGLMNQKRTPKNSPRRTSKYWEDKVMKLKRALKKISGKRMKMEFGIPLAGSTIDKIYRRNGESRKRWRKYKKKQDLREKKKNLRVFEKIQIDIKDLSDIPNYFEQSLRTRLPRYQFTARDVKSGALFISYARTKELNNAATFCAYLLAHLQRMGIDLSKVNIQTDNDGAFVGNWKPGSFSSFTYVIEQIFKAKHLRIPPAAPTYNSDVETVHARIEEELYDIEEVFNAYDLRGKGYSYMIYFNLIRPNSSKDYKSPLKIIAEEYEKVDPNLLTLPPIMLDDNFKIYLNAISYENNSKVGHHVPGFTMTSARLSNVVVPFFVFL